MKLTDATATKLTLPAGKTDIFVPDPDLKGHGVRVRRSSASGAISRTWEALPKRLPNGQQRRGHFGNVGAVLIKDARRACQIHLGKIARGEDPAAEREQAREEAEAQRLTLGAVIPRYLKAKTLRPSSRKLAERYLNRVWAGLHTKPLGTITRRDVAPALEEFVIAHGRSVARAARSNLAGLFAWAIEHSLVEHNPTVGTKDPAKNVAPRDRVLTDAELATVWHACSDDTPGRIIRLLILCPCRRDEISDLQWSEIDFGTGVLTIPGERTKNHRTLILTLAPAALAILKTAPRREGVGFVFGKSGSTGGFGAWSHAKLRLDHRIAVLNGRPLAPWTIHDLRRTARTGMSKLKVRPDIAELALGHFRKNLQAIYDKHEYQEEIAAALRLWAKHVVSVVRKRHPIRETSIAA